MTRLYVEDADLYDIAFDWDIADEVDWLVERLGSECRSVLEPGCGSGRMLAALADRGFEVTGIDLSSRMIELARARLATDADVSVADMTDFELARTFDAAVSPINTLLHLTPAQLARHLECVARHLRVGGKYLTQVGLVDATSDEPFAQSHWEANRGATTLRVDWVDERVDLSRGVSVQRSRIEVLAGDRAGEVIEELHEVTAWTPESWRRAIDSSPFTEAATYDGGRKGEWPFVDGDAVGGLLWHELRRD